MYLISVLEEYHIYSFKCNIMVFIIFQTYKRILKIVYDIYKYLLDHNTNAFLYVL